MKALMPHDRNFFDTSGAHAERAKRQKKAAEEPRANGHAQDDADLWRDRLIRSDTGKVLRTLANVLIALRTAPAWQGVLAWDEFASRPKVMRNPPSGRQSPTPRDMNDFDVGNATDWMQHAGIVVPLSVVKDALVIAAADHSFHPVRQYLAGLAWDGTPRIDMWLTDHLGAEDTELHRAYAANWLIGLVARVMRPGCKLDTALILEQGQGFRKSTALAILAGPWFTDHLADLNGKDALLQLQGVWIIELAELSSLGRAETHRVKSFLTTQVDHFRSPYGHFTVDHPRQCGFAGTINPGGSGYLRDETGARRFWPVACGTEWSKGQRIDTDAIEAVRDQLWAEAYHRFQAGEPWHLSDRLEEEQAVSVADRQEDDPREPRIRYFISGRAWVRMDEILGPDCLCVPIDRWTRQIRMEIGQVMTGLGWQRKRVRKSEDWQNREWRYFSPS
jgi:predicted P-loop ATPase